MLFSQQSFIALAAGCLIVFASSDASAQQRLQQGGATGQTGAAAGQGGAAGGMGGGGQIGAPSDTGPSGAVTGEISRSADRVLSDAGAQPGAARGGAQGGMGGLGGMRGMGGAMGGFGGMSPFGANPFGANNNAAQTPSVRTRLRADIQAPIQSSQMTTARVQRHMASAPIQRRVNGFSVSVLDGVATLSGTTSNDRDRRMAELVLRLEPGVRQINNQIVVSP